MAGKPYQATQRVQHLVRGTHRHHRPLERANRYWLTVVQGSRRVSAEIRQRGLGKLGCSRWPHKPEITGSNPVSPTPMGTRAGEM